jgi:hypothetical protein
MLKDGVVSGTYTDLFSGEPVEVAQGKAIPLEAWGYMVLTK